MTLLGDQTGWIVAEIEWRILHLTAPLEEHMIHHSRDAGLHSHVVAHMDLELTLTDRLPPEHANMAGYGLNKGFTPAAFRPKRYAVRLEAGEFLSHSDVRMITYCVEHSLAMPWPSVYAFRLVFDRQPFPPPEEWGSGAGRWRRLYSISGEGRTSVGAGSGSRRGGRWRGRRGWRGG